MLYTKFQGHQLLGSEEEDVWRIFPYIGLEAILVMWPETFEQMFIPKIRWRVHMKFSFNSLVLFEEEKFENVESEWSWTKVNELPRPYVVINRHIIIYLTNVHLTSLNSFSEIYNLSIFIFKSKGTKFDRAVK